MSADELDPRDVALLDLIQSGFPLESRPYAVLGERLGMSEQEVFERVETLRQSGLIRRLGANFQSAKLGFVSTLCAAKVPEDKLDRFVAAVNALPGVTHNYERDNEYNIWFTLIGSSEEERERTLTALEKATGVDILNLPATRLYKIKVDFRLG